MGTSLTWDATYEIAASLRNQYAHIALEDVSLNMIFEWVIHLPTFDDDVELGNDDILNSIYQEWLELSLQE